MRIRQLPVNCSSDSIKVIDPWFKFVIEIVILKQGQHHAYSVSNLDRASKGTKWIRILGRRHDGLQPTIRTLEDQTERRR